MESNYHIPVLLAEVINGLELERPGWKVVVDATAGGMGHSAEIAAKLHAGDTLVCIDKDADAIKLNKHKIVTKAKVIFVNDGFENIKKILDENNIDQIDAVMADLGVSSHQIDTPERGFSYMHEGPLDMRMDRTAKTDASHVVNHYTEARLCDIIKEYGEERYAKIIARAIVAARPIKTTAQLAKVIVDAVPGSYFKTGGHPAKRTFQAIRIEVNRELENLKTFLNDAVARLRPGGRIAVITFHSLEDRIVKQTFVYMNKECTCPPKTPKCICGKTKILDILTKKPIEPTPDEARNNPRSTSAKLRIGGKI